MRPGQSYRDAHHPNHPVLLTCLRVMGLRLAVGPQPNVHQRPDLLHGGQKVVQNKIPETVLCRYIVFSGIPYSSLCGDFLMEGIIYHYIVPGVRTKTLVVHVHSEHRVRGLGGQQGGDGHHGLPGDVWLGDVPVAVQDPDQESCSQATAELERLRDLDIGSQPSFGGTVMSI